jgi:hypothetical protein
VPPSALPVSDVNLTRGRVATHPGLARPMPPAPGKMSLVRGLKLLAVRSCPRPWSVTISCDQGWLLTASTRRYPGIHGGRLLSLDVANYVREQCDTGGSERTTVDTYPHEVWQHLGRALERRRGELGYGFRQRGRFIRERGAGMISIKTISRLEKGERSSYPESTIGAAEAMYQWAPGSFESVLRGGEPDPLVVAPAPRRNPITTGHAPPTSGERITSWVYVRMRQLGHSDDAVHEFIAAEGLPREPTTVSAVQRIAEVTGASVAEILALLGVEDINARRAPRLVRNNEIGGEAEALPTSASDPRLKATLAMPARSASQCGDVGIDVPELALFAGLTALLEPAPPRGPRVGHDNVKQPGDSRYRRRQSHCDSLLRADRVDG